MKFRIINTAAKRIICFMTALAICVSCMVLTAGPVFADDNAVQLGISEISTDSGFASALADPAVSVIRLTANINAAPLNWQTVQKGPKTIIGMVGTERLALPSVLYAAEALSFDHLTLVRGTQEGTAIYANSHRFHFGPALTFEEGFISAIFGGGYQVTGGNAEIVLESGIVGAVYCGANRGILTGTSNVTLYGTASVGGVYASYENVDIRGKKALTLIGFGTAAGYRQQLPAILGVDELILDNSFVRMVGWPANIAAGRMTIRQNACLWLDGNTALPVPIHGENAGLIVTAGSVVTLPNPETVPGFISGRLNLSLSGGTSAAIINGGAYRNAFVLSENFHVSTGSDLTIQQLFLNRIELISAPVKTTYFLGETLDTSGGVIRAYYDPAELGVIKDIPVTPDMVSGFDSQRLGLQTLTVEYEGKTCAYTIWMADPAVAKLGIQSVPDRTTYQVGDSLNVSGGKVLVRYNNGAIYHIPFNDSSVVVNGFDSAAPGRLTLGVSYNGQSAGTYQVTVRAALADSDSDDRSAKADIPDSERIVSIKGIPDGNTVKVGERFTLSASPNRRGDWDWNEDYFDGEINHSRNTLTLEALRKGSSRISYNDGTAHASEIVRITELSNDFDEPDDEPREIVTGWEQSEVQSYESGSEASSQVEETTKETPNQREPVKEPDPEPAASKPETPQTQEALPLPETKAEEGMFGGRTERIPMVVAGILASITVLAAAGAGIWRYVNRA